jgi:hypothetical protein
MGVSSRQLPRYSGGLEAFTHLRSLLQGGLTVWSELSELPYRTHHYTKGLST